MLCFDASKTNRCASTPARIAVLRCQQGAGSAIAAEGRFGSPGGVASQKRKTDQVGGLSGWISFRMRERWGVVWWCWRRGGVWFGGVERGGLGWAGLGWVGLGWAGLSR